VAGKESNNSGNESKRVSISRLQLTDFRNYRHIETEFQPGIVVLTGENGAGKTNLLEAISLLSPGRGLRRANLASIACTGGSSGFSVFAQLDGPSGSCAIGTGVEGMAGNGETVRKIRINGANARSSSALLEWIRIVWMTPAMDGLFTGPASDRRRFVDRLVLAIDTNHARRTIDFEKAMRNRNRLLTDNVRDDRWFDAIEHEMSESGVAIAAARMELVRLLRGKLAGLDRQGPFPRSEIEISGAIERLAGEMPSVDAEIEFARLLSQNRNRDRAAGRTLDGPHRSDLLVTHCDKDMPAELCSTGEQKALLVGLVLSHAQLTGDIAGMSPVLLMDEIAAHLDAGRRAALFEIIEDMNCQAFMTGTDTAPFSALKDRAGFMSVADGTVKSL
jgi:DNA replication and repair protein RecF